MLNRFSNLATTELAGDGPFSDWNQRPGMRLGLWFVLCAACLGGIALRLVQLQWKLSGAYLAEFNRTIEKREPIPSRDGRILTAEGHVLAEDVEIFSVQAHYRWLEEPVNPGWLKQQALSRLKRADRRRPALVRREMETILRQRTELWQRLAVLSHQDPARLRATCSRIQSRIEKLRATLEARRAPAESPAAISLSSADFTLAGCWEHVKAALTTPPSRGELEPLVLAEELDYHSILPEVSLAKIADIESHPEQYPGLRVCLTTRRRYAQGEVAPHVIGYRVPISDEQLQRRQTQYPHGSDPLDYRPADRIGMSGLEKYYERQLRGLRGEKSLIYTRSGELLRTDVLRRPRLGRDLVLTLNLPVQRAAEQLLDEALQSISQDEITGRPLPLPQGGAIVALDVRTGAVLAAASAPRFDVNTFVLHDTAAWERIAADHRKPLFSRPTHMTLPPGSVFKAVSALAYLQEGTIDPEATFHCQGFLDTSQRYRCAIFRSAGVGHGDLSLVDALARSCNVYFFATARRGGPEALHEWGARLGFGTPTGVDLPDERSGNLPPLPVVPAGKRRRLSGDTLGLAIGQAQLTATPLQVARMMAAIANGGKLVTPRLVETTGLTMSEETGGLASDDVGLVESQEIPDLSPSALAWVRRGLQMVVADSHGTGYKTVRLPDISIAGKTGTAEAGGQRPDHAWFAGYVPADRPRVAFVVVLEHAGSGGHAAGPLARKFVQSMRQQGLLSNGGPLPAPTAN